jgi:pyridoxine 5-phosphate synthase
MAATDEMFAIASEVRPGQVTFVPEKREEVTTEGGLDVVGNREKIERMSTGLKELGIITSMFIDPDKKQIDASKEIGSDCIELHTGEYANAKTMKEQTAEYERISNSAEYAHKKGLEVHAGHGLTYINIRPIASIREISGYYIGHSIMARAIYVGLEKAVKDMVILIHNE